MPEAGVDGEVVAWNSKGERVEWVEDESELAE